MTTTTATSTEICIFVHVGQACAVSSVEMLPGFSKDSCPECGGAFRRATAVEAARIEAAR